MDRRKFKIVLFLFFISIGFIFAADWPNWRGPNYDGISTETDWDPQSLNTPDVVWSVKVGTGFSAVSLADGKAYVMGNIDKETDVIYCFDALTGEEIWTRKYSEPLAPKYYEGGCSATPTVHDGEVYTLSKKGVAFCLNADTGDIIWKKTLSFETPTWGFSGSAIILDDLAIYNVGSAGLALNKATGEIVWKSENDVSGYATPVPYKQGDKSCICIFGKDSVMGIETKTGTVLWSYPWETKYDVNAADPIISGNEVFITSGYNHGCALLKLDGDKPQLLWENKNMRSQMSGPVLIDGYLYGIDNNQLVCVEWQTGKQMWAEKAPQKGSLSAAGDKLIVMGETGKLYIVQASPDSFKELSSAQVLDNRCWTMPVLANGHLYVRNTVKKEPDRLICIDVQKRTPPVKTTSQNTGSNAEWPQWRGPKRDGISTETGLLKEWPAEGPQMLWSADGIGQGYGTVAIADGKICVTGMVEDQGILTCLDLSGNKLWQANYGPEWKRSFPGTRCTPTIYQDHVYVISGTGQAACFKIDDGEKVWQVDAYGQFEGQYPNWGYAESPLIVDDKVIVTAGGIKALFAALDKKDGSVVWTTSTNGDKSAFCSPTTLEWAGKTIIVNMSAKHILGVDQQDGTVLFSYPVSNYITAKVRGNHPNTPIVKDGKIFVSSGYDMGSIQLQLSADGNAVEKCWTNPSLDNHHGGIVLVDGKLYGANWQSNKQGKWICVDWETGKTLYEQEWGNKGSLTYADGMLYCYEEASGTVGLAAATPDGFNVISSFKVQLGQKEHWAHPVVCGKRLYIRHGDVLMTFDIAEEAK